MGYQISHNAVEEIKSIRINLENIQCFFNHSLIETALADPEIEAEDNLKLLMAKHFDSLYDNKSCERPIFSMDTLVNSLGFSIDDVSNGVGIGMFDNTIVKQTEDNDDEYAFFTNLEYLLVKDNQVNHGILHIENILDKYRLAWDNGDIPPLIKTALISDPESVEVNSLLFSIKVC